MARRRSNKSSEEELAEAAARAAAEAAESAGDGGLTDLIKKMAYLGVGTVFATQETASRMVKDLKLPREAVQSILQVAERNRDEFIRAATATMRDFLYEVDLINLLKETLNGMNVKVSAEFSLNYDEDAKAPRRRSRGKPAGSKTAKK